MLVSIERKPKNESWTKAAVQFSRKTTQSYKSHLADETDVFLVVLRGFAKKENKMENLLRMPSPNSFKMIYLKLTCKIRKLLEHISQGQTEQ